MITKITNNDLQTAMTQDVAVIDFSATWCGPCKMIEPILEELSEEMAGKVSFYNVDSDENPLLVDQFSVMNIPTIFLVKNGQVIDRVTGFQPKPQLQAWIESK